MNLGLPAAGSYPISRIVGRDVSVPVSRLFDKVAEDVLPKLVHRCGLVPAVVGTDEVTGPWDTPGFQRRVRTGAGRRVCEEVIAWERPRRFAYRVDDFTGIAGRLVTHAVSEWTFSGNHEHSRFAWTYTFFAANRASVPLVRLFVTFLWSGHMRRCADRCAEIAQAPEPTLP